MNRRKFLIGVGGASVAGSALIGTGAFSRVESQRSVTIEVAQDPDAYLGLDKCDTPNGSYTDFDGDGHLEIRMNPDNENHPDNDLGAGVNSDSRSWFDNVVQICNQGKEAACVHIEDDEDWPYVTDDEEERRVDFYLGDDRDDSIIGEGNAFDLDVGDCVCVGLRTTTHGLGADEVDSLLEDLEDTVTLVADVDGDCFEDGEIECTECAIPDDVTGDFMNIEEVDDSDFPEVSMTVRVETEDGIDGNLTDDFVVCETFGGDDFGQVESVTFAGEDEDAQADVMICFDTSGSMSGTEIENAREGAKELVDSLGPGVNVGLVEFSSSATLVTSLTSDHQQVKDDIDDLSAGGGTDMADGIATSQDELDSNGRSGVPHFMVILGDGATSGESEATDAKGKGTIIYGIAYGTGTDVSDYEEIVGEIEDDPDWEDYAFAADTEDISDIFGDIGGIISGTYNITYTSCNPDMDGSQRDVRVYVDDPDEGEAIDSASYTAPGGT
ncbi:MAG: VWA domain-containing protein [archaeon]